jgi:hypothetical protein
LPDDDATAALRAEYRRLIDHTLPATFTEPVRFNHCFARCVLDRICGGVWYECLAKPAWKHLTRDQLERANARMKAWLEDPALLAADNAASLRWRGKC